MISYTRKNTSEYFKEFCRYIMKLTKKGENLNAAKK